MRYTYNNVPRCGTVKNFKKRAYVKISFYLIVLMALFFSGCAPKNYVLFNQNTELVKSIDNNETLDTPFRYKIRIHDRISVLFYEHADLGTRKIGDLQADNVGILVDSYGSARFPLIGAIQVAGLYQDELNELLEQRYAEFIVNPQINVDVLNKRIVVVGEIQKPGVVRITNETMNLFEALASAGGPTAIGKREGVIIIRGDLRDPQMSIIDLTDMSNIMAHNLTLQPSDIVYVAPNLNLVVGQGLTSSQILNLILGAGVSMKTLTGF